MRTATFAFLALIAILAAPRGGGFLAADATPSVPAPVAYAISMVFEGEVPSCETVPVSDMEYEEAWKECWDWRESCASEECVLVLYQGNPWKCVCTLEN